MGALTTALVVAAAADWSWQFVVPKLNCVAVDAAVAELRSRRMFWPAAVVPAELRSTAPLNVSLPLSARRMLTELALFLLTFRSVPAIVDAMVSVLARV